VKFLFIYNLPKFTQSEAVIILDFLSKPSVHREAKEEIAHVTAERNPSIPQSICVALSAIGLASLRRDKRCTMLATYMSVHSPATTSMVSSSEGKEIGIIISILICCEEIV
jgi:hypothetical protein